MIILHARGNKDIGIGNLARSYELLKEISKTKEAAAVFECDEKLFERYKGKNTFRSNNLKNSISIIKKQKCDVYICDLIDASKELSDTLRSMGVKAIIHLNGLEFGFEPDKLIVSDGFDYRIEAKNVEVYRGFKYYIVGEDIVKNRKKSLPLYKSLKNILICFGGADPAFYTEHFAKIINDNIYNYTIVLGPAMSEERKKSITSIQKKNISYIDSPAQMTKLLLDNDLLITLGGMTTYEAMCLGVPACAVRWQYLSYIVENFGKKHMITDLGEIENAYENLLNLDISQVNIICQNAYNLIDGSSLKNIDKIVDISIQGN